MSDALNPVTENDLHAYADGQMAADDAARVEILSLIHISEPTRRS